MDQTKTGRLIRALRQGQNLTQAELGEKLGVGGKAVSKWECGAGAPGIAPRPNVPRKRASKRLRPSPQNPP